LRKRLDDKDSQGESLNDSIEQLKTKLEAQKARHEDVKALLSTKDTELEQALAAAETSTKEAFSRTNAEISGLKKRVDEKDLSVADELQTIGSKLKSQGQKMESIKAALGAKDDELDAKIAETDERLVEA
jgi:chromosome segregation ATPase